MLSYRHAYHAGNFADVLKHLVLVQVIEYLKLKPAPIRYIDTHAGAGCYDVGGNMSRKTDEFRDGAGRLNFDGSWTASDTYVRALQPFLTSGQYPGSPLIAATLLRPQDALRLYELHPTDYPLLAQQFHRDRRVRTFNADGYGALKSQLPPAEGRAVVLVDPSYEVKDDYHRVSDAVARGLRRMSHAICLIWYPVVDRGHLNPMLRRLDGLSDKTLRVELRMEDSASQRRMHSSGMFLINPPWTLAAQLQDLLERVCQQLPAAFEIHASGQ